MRAYVVPMPRYRLHVSNSFGLAEDKEGQALPDLDAARDEAVRGIRSLLADELKSGKVDLRGRVDVVDDADRLLITVPFDEAFAIVR